MPVSRAIAESQSKMSKAVEVLQDELRGLRGGRASPAMVENLKVEYYGTPTPLKTLATISAPEVDMLVIKPFDPAAVRDVEKAIKNSDLSIAPVVDGKLIRLSIPHLSEERRRQLVQQAKQAAEQTRVSIRNIRRDVNKHLEMQQKDKLITEDDLKAGKKQIDDLTKEYTDKVDQIVKHKADEIMSG